MIWSSCRPKKTSIAGLTLLLLIAGNTGARADQNYSQQVFFENSLSPENYFYSSGKASPPSTLKLLDEKLPVNNDTFISSPNSLELQWKSVPNGGWSAEVRLYEWRNRTKSFPGAKLFLWLYDADGIDAVALPHLALRDTGGNFTQPLDLGAFTKDIKPRSWTRVGIPLTSFRTASVNAFLPHRVNTLILVQGNTDARPHTLLLDDIRIEDDPPEGQAAPPTPAGLRG